MAAIDIGADAINRANTSPSEEKTVLGLENPANGTGGLDTVEVWAEREILECKFGTLYGTSPDFTSRDSEVVGTIPFGSKQTFSGLTISVETGDYIGFYAFTGKVEMALTGVADIFYQTGDLFGAGEQSYFTQTTSTLSLYGTGETTIPDVTISPPFVNINAAVPLPTFSGGITLTIPLVNIDSAVSLPTFSGGVTLSPPLVNLAVAVFIPTIILPDITLYPPLVNLAIGVPAPTLSIGLNLLPPVVNIDLAAPTPTLEMGVTLIIPLVDIDVAVFIPVIIWRELCFTILSTIAQPLRIVSDIHQPLDIESKIGEC